MPKSVCIIFILLAALVAIPLAYDLPLLLGGLDNINMVRHFDHGESEIALGWIESYSRGPLYAGYAEQFLAYPKLFYNTAGVFLYPYSVFSDPDYKTILIVWRSLNMLIGVGALIVLFFLVKRVFRSNPIAFLATFFYAITPQFLLWTANIRPNPLEQLLIFTTLLICVRMCERYSLQLFLLATLTSALAFAAKFGSIPFMVLIPLLALYLVWRQEGNRERFSEIIYELSRISRLLFLPAAVLSAVGSIGFIWFLSSERWDGVSLFYRWAAPGIQPDKLPRLLEILQEHALLVNVAAWGSVIGFAVITVAALAISRHMNRLAAQQECEPGRLIYGSAAVSFLLFTGMIYTLVFFAVGPAYIANPEHFFSQVGYEFRYIALGASYGIESSPPSLLQAIRQIGDMLHPGWLVFAPLLGYSVWTHTREFRGPSVDRDQRFFLWSFAIMAILLWVASKNPSVRHGLPGIAILYAFAAEAIIKGLQGWRTRISGSSVAVVVAMLLLLVVGFHVRETYYNWNNSWEKSADIGLTVGAWLSQNYPDDTQILTDRWLFYTPPRFDKVASAQLVEREQTGKGIERKQEAVRNLILEFDPEVIIVANSQQHTMAVDVASLLATDPALKDFSYQVVKTFASSKPRDQFSQVQIFEKGDQDLGLNRGSGS